MNLLRRPVAAAALLLLAGGAFHAACVGREHRSPSWRGHNVIWISFDSVRADHCSFNGYARNTTPNLASLATRGVNFSNCVAQAPYTLPSYASMLSSRYVSELAVQQHTEGVDVPTVAPSLRPENVLFSEILKAKGYRTAAFVQSWLSEGLGFNQGWDLFRFRRESLRDKLPPALAWLEANKAQRFFAFLYTTDIHYPFLHFHEKKGLYGHHGSDFNYTLDAILKVRSGELKPSREDLASAMALYDEGIHWTDGDLAPLFDTLGRTGLMEKTIIVFNADHGQEFGEHGVISHGQTYYEGVIKTPLVIYAPRLAGTGRAIPYLVQNVDIVPTVLDMLEIPAPGPMSGRSLKPFLTTPDLAPDGPRLAYSEGAWSFWVGAVLRDKRKLIYVSPGEQMLFDVGADPGETVNLLAREAKAGRDLEGLLFSHLRSADAVLRAAASSGPSAYDTWMSQVMRHHHLDQDRETLEQLKALGYVR